MKFLCIAAVCSALLASSAKAQTGSISFTLTSSNAAYVTNCATTGVPALSFGVSGASAGSPLSYTAAGSLGSFQIFRNIDPCSDSLLHAFLSTAPYETLKLTQYGKNNGKDFARNVITLSNVYVTSYALSGSATADPIEELLFGYQKMCVATTDIDSAGGLTMPVTVCYDQLKNIVTD